MKCVINKLSAVINDNTLPVFSGSIVRKNYITTTQDGQYIDVTSVFADINYDKMKVECILQHAGGNASRATVLQTNYGYAFLYANTGTRLQSKLGSTLQDNVTVSANTDVNIGFDGIANKAWVGTTETIGETAPTSSSSGKTYLFSNVSGTDSLAGIVKIKELKVYNDGVLSADLVPVIYDEVACLYDTISQTFYYEAGDGTLSAFD